MKSILSGVLLTVAVALTLQAQSQLPQNYHAPDEIITLSPDMSFEQAFEILSKISMEKEGKTIIDPAKRQHRIDVEIVNLPWKKALDVILKSNSLEYEEHEQFYEIVGAAKKVEPGKEEISIATREVRIEAIFFEADRQALAESGIDWSILRAGNLWSGSFGVDGATGVSDEIVEGSFAYSKNVDGTTYDVAGLLRSFESDQLGRILAQPEIVVISGKQGRIQVGQDFSIKTRDFAGNVIDNFFSTGTIMRVTPIIYVEDNVEFIHLNIHAERSSAVPDVVSTRINKSEALTDAILVNGESTSIGGLYSREMSKVRKGVPVLKDLPWWVFGLRYIFGQTLDDVSDKELLVIIRATIIPTIKTRFQTKRQEIMQEFDINREKSLKSIDNSWQKGVTENDEK